MSLICNGCGEEIERWGAKLLVSQDHLSGQPNNPQHADTAQHHLCPKCRDRYVKDFVTFVHGGNRD